MFSKRNAPSSGSSARTPRAGSSNDSQRRSSSVPRSGGYLSAVPKATSRIDPQILLDIQSNGLSSRIVKYHEENQRSSRPLRYTRPGQFPIVHFKKNDIVYSTKRNNALSAVKIAAPDKSVSDRNLRLNILRDGLSVPSRIPTAEDFHPRKLLDNEPLTPSTEDVETTPTRSVLDALTEISRKRIHHEDFIIDERSKKPCKDTTEVDSGHQFEVRMGQTKRQREKTSPVSPSEVQKGVEAKQKKVCRDSHDILSSLSSSVRLLNPKRRLDDVSVGDAKRMNNQRSPQPPVEQRKSIAVTPSETRTSDYTSTPKIPQRTSPQQTVQEIPKSVVKSAPKVTLFNQNYDKIQNRVLSDDEDETGSKSMNLIRPKKDSLLLVRDKNVSKNGTKSKLALMLSYLSRNFDEDSNDVVDSKDETIVSNPDPVLPKENPVNITEAPTVISTSNTVTSTIVSTQAETVTTTSVVSPVTTLTAPVEKKDQEKSAPIFPIKFDTPFKVVDTSSSSVVNPPAPVVQAPAENHPKDDADKKTSEPVKPSVSQPLLCFPSVSTNNSFISPSPVVSLSPANPAVTLYFGDMRKAPTMTTSSLGVPENKSQVSIVPAVPATTSAASSVGFKFGPQVQSPPITTTVVVTSNPMTSASSFFTFKPLNTSTGLVSSAASTSPAITATPICNFGGQLATSTIPTTTSESQFSFTGNTAPVFGDISAAAKNTETGGGSTDKWMSSGGMKPATATTTNNAFMTPFTPQAPSFTSTSNTGFPGVSSSPFSGFGTTTTTASSAVFTPKTSVETKSLFTFGPTTTTSASPLTFPNPTTMVQKTSFPSAFDSVTTTSSTSIFGGNQGNLSTPATVTTNASIFSSGGGSISTTSFTGGSFPAAPKFGVTPATTSAGGSIFSPTTSSPFGGFNQQQQQQKTSVASEWGKSPFSGFGGVTTTSSNPPATATSSGSLFTFGGGAINKPQQPTTTSSSISGGIFGSTQATSNVFGSMASTDKPFSFSGAPSAQSPFEAAAAATTSAISSPFSFTGGVKTTSSAPAPVFGGSSSSTSTFTFGQTPTPAPPTFGSGTPVFGGVTSSGPPPPPSYESSTSAAPAFNFGGSATPTGQPQQQPSASVQPFVFGQSNQQQPGNNIFSIGTNGGGSAPQRRPFRTATRRLNK